LYLKKKKSYNFTRFESQSLGPGNSCSSSEKEFKDRHRGDLSGSRFINAKQSKRALSDKRMYRLKKEPCAGGPKTSRFFGGSMDMRVVSP
jgi:hypothetical protein